jgi:hydrogenase assembly chaperone HypC/HupF
MCLMLPARVVSITSSSAIVQIGSRRRRVSTLAVPEALVGDWGLVSAGSLVKIIDPSIAADIAAAFRVATQPDPVDVTGETP